MSQHSVSFKYKGHRNYIQGPDIIDAVISLLKNEFIIDEIKNFKYASHKILHTNGIITISHDLLNDIYSLISFNYKGEKYYASVQGSDSNVKESRNYDESPIVDYATINGISTSILYDKLNQFSFSELIVAMNKHFLQTTFKEKGKWIVTKAEYQNLVSVNAINNSIISLDLIKNINFKLTKSAIKVNNQIIGYLYFSLI